MNLTGIISISGIPGLSKVVAKTKNGLIAEGLFDKKRFPVHAADKISALEDISIFTEEGEHPLKDVLKSIRDKEASKACGVDVKDAPALTKYFEVVLPNYDKAKVYNSDIKKVINWYNLLQQANLLADVEETKDDAKEGEEKPKKAKAKLDGDKPKITKAKTEKKVAKPNAVTKASKTSTIRKTGA